MNNSLHLIKKSLALDVGSKMIEKGMKRSETDLKFKFNKVNLSGDWAMVITSYCVPMRTINGKQNLNSQQNAANIFPNRLLWNEDTGSRGNTPVNFFLSHLSDSRKTWEKPVLYVNIIGHKSMLSNIFDSS